MARPSAIPPSLLLQAAALGLNGVVLAVLYRPDPSRAFADVAGLPSVLRGHHFWGAAVLFAQLAILVGLMVWQGRYQSERGPFLAAVVGSLLALAALVTGNGLPYDRHAVQSVVAEASVASQSPVLGAELRRVALQGDAYHAGTLSAWYWAHWAAGLTALATCLWLARRVQFSVRAFLPLGLAATLAIFLPAPLGSGASPVDYALADVHPGWYVWPMHGALTAVQQWGWAGWIGAMALPGLFIGFLVLLPFWRPKPAAARSLLGGFAGLFALLGGLYAGPAAPVTGNRDPVARTAFADLGTVHAGEDRAMALRGRELFNTKGCSGCHGTDGRKAGLGPNLSQVHREHSDPAWYVRFIADPASVMKGSPMPAFKDLKQQELRALAEFLRFPRGG